MAALLFLCYSPSLLHVLEKASPLFSPTMSRPLPVACPQLSRTVVEQLLAAIQRPYPVAVELPLAVFLPFFPAPVALILYRQLTTILRIQGFPRTMMCHLDQSAADRVEVRAFF